MSLAYVSCNLMRVAALISVCALFLIAASFVGYTLAEKSRLTALQLSEEKWQKEISLREEQIAGLERDLNALKNKSTKDAARPFAPSEKSNLRPASSPIPPNDAPRANLESRTLQNFILEPTPGGLAIQNLGGQPLLEINGNRVSFGTNTFLGPNGETFMNRAEVAGDLRSGDSKAKVALTFKNRISEEAYLYWIDFQGVPKFYKTLKAGEEHRQETFLTHPWVVIDHNGTKLGELLPEKDDEEIVLTR